VLKKRVHESTASSRILTSLPFPWEEFMIEYERIIEDEALPWGILSK
jgi:hypothetical protein